MKAKIKIENIVREQNRTRRRMNRKVTYREVLMGYLDACLTSGQPIEWLTKENPGENLCEVDLAIYTLSMLFGFDCEVIAVDLVELLAEQNGIDDDLMANLKKRGGAIVYGKRK